MERAAAWRAARNWPRFVRETPAGRQVKIGVWRNGSMQTLTATMETGQEHHHRQRRELHGHA